MNISFGKSFILPKSVDRSEVTDHLLRKGVPYVECDQRGLVIGDEAELLSSILYTFYPKQDPLEEYEPVTETKEMKAIKRSFLEGAKEIKDKFDITA